MTPNLTITPAADKFMRRIVRFSGLPEGAGFRLLVSPGGCSGYNAEFSAEAAPQPGESTMDVNGLRIFLPAESRLMLDGLIMDFVDRPTQSGLVFTNPNAEACACSSADTGAGAPALTAGVTHIGIGSIQRGGRPVAPVAPTAHAH